MTAPIVLLSLFLAQQQGGRGPQPPANPEPIKLTEEKPVVTKHTIQSNGRSLSYTATTGFMPLKNAQGEIEANLFYVAYTLDGVQDASKRPLLFAFNGGPGSASVWLHMG